MSSMTELVLRKPHAVCIPQSAQGHINPMLQLAKILHSRGFHITFVYTEYIHNRLLRSCGSAAVADHSSFRFETIPDGLPRSDNTDDSAQDIPSLCVSLEQNGLGPFKELLARLNEAYDVPPVSCIVSDATMFFTIDAAQELGIPGVLFWTASVCGLLGYAQYQKLVDLGLIPFKDANFSTNGALDVGIDWISSMKGIRLRDIPSFIRTTDPNDVMLNYTQRLVHNSKRATAILFNSFDALEYNVLQSFSSDFPPFYTIGPLQLLDFIEAKDEVTESINMSLWKEDRHCLDWLDSYEPNSVVYVNFGSVTVMTGDQLKEFAWGLANSNQPFLWITRPDLVTGESTILPHEFLSATKDRGLIISWCNQIQVLTHPAIGGFLTHCGWNSTMESLINGVPMICWPFFAEQHTNCWSCCNKLGVGIEIDVNVMRSEVERQVRELMEGRTGKDMKRKAMEWRRLAHEVVAPPHGTSYNNLNKVINLLVGSLK